MSSMLAVDIVRRLDHITLRAQMEVGAEILVLFGPSGAGKTQTLQAIAGLMTPDEGEIVLNETIFFRRRAGQPFIHLPPQQRRVGYVFQQYALFPHMTALENVALPMGSGRAARRRAYELLERMHLAHLAQRMPSELSGGQQQRVAIARALAVRPTVLLCDESFSALDQPIRQQLHAELRAVQTEHGLSVIYVTHNLDDAFAVGHRIAIMREGRIEQIGPLAEVCRSPAHPQLLHLLGLTNIISAQVETVMIDRVMLNWQGWQIEAALPESPVVAGNVVTAFIRAEEIRFVYPDRPRTRFAGYNLISGRIRDQRPGRRMRHVWVDVGGVMLEVAHPYAAYLDLDTGSGRDVQMAFRPESVVIVAEPNQSRQRHSETTTLATATHKQ